MKKIYHSGFFLFFFFAGLSAFAQPCSPCPQAFNLADSARCNSVDVIKNASVSNYYQNLQTVNACKNSRVKYTLSVNPACYPVVNYTLVSITGGALISFINNQFVIQWGASNTGTVSIAFNIPSAAGSAPCSDTMNLSFTLLNNPVAAFTVSPQPACFNSPTNISFNSSGSVNAVSYFWNFGDGFTSTLANPVHPYTAPGTYTVTLIVTNSQSSNGQPAACPFCVDSVHHNVVINATPGPSIVCVASVCAGSKVKYCTGTLGCGTYVWTVTGGTIQSGQNTPCITVLWGSGSPQGTINLVVTGCPAAACTSGTTVTIPIIPLTGTITGPPSPVCIGSTGLYTLPYWPGTVYNWSLSGGGVMSPYNTNTGQVTINWTTGGSFLITCNYFDSSLNCGGTASLPVLVRPVMTINGIASLCQNGSSSLNAVRPTNIPVPCNWVITPAGATITSGNGTGTINVNWPTPGVYTVTATSLTPVVCGPASYTVTVLAAPVLTSINGADSVCKNHVYVYSVTSNQTGPYIWSVTNGAAVNLGANNDSVQVTWGNSGPYSLSVFQISFPNNCVSNTLVKNVFPYPTPIVTGATSVCADNIQNYTITNIATGNFQWSVYPPSFGTIITGQGTASVQIKWHGNNSPGSSHVVHLYFGVCMSDSIAITINEPPLATITASGTLCAGGVTLSTGATGTFTWTCSEHAVVPTPGNTPSITVSLFGHYHVQIQNYNGTGCTVTADYFVPNTGAPVAHISATNVLTYCLPNTPNMNLVANNAPGYTFQWFLGNSLIGTTNPFPISPTVAGSYSYHCVVHLGTCTDTSNVITVVITTCPVIPPGPCSGAAINVTNIAGCNPFTLSIAATGPAGATINTPPNPTITHTDDGSTVNSFTTHTYTTTGYHPVTICADVLLADNVTVCRVCKDTVVLVSAAANFTGVIGCRKLNLFDASTTISPIVVNSYTWLIGNNPGNTAVPPVVASFNANNIPNPVVTVNQSGSYIITEVVKFSNGCTVSHMDTFNIIVPDANFNITNSCVGTPVNFVDLFPGASDFWNFGDLATSYTNPTFHAYAAPGTYNVTHIVTDINGCRDTIIKPITIVAAPVCNISYAGPTSFCFGNTLALNACPGYTSYQWYNNGVAIPGATTPVENAAQTGNYSFTAISGSGCNVVSDTVSLTVSQPPNVLISTSGSVCAGSNFYATVQTCAGCFYQWNVDNIPTVFANQISGVSGTAPFTNGTHSITVIVTNAAGCTDSSTISRTFFALPLVGITVAPNPSPLCSNNVYTLTAVTNASAPSYAWNYNNQPPVLSVISSLIASADGSYTVQVTDGITGCQASATKFILPSPDLNLFPIGCDSLCDTSHIFLPLPSLNGNLAGYTINWYDNAPPYITPVGSGISFPLISLIIGNHNLSVIVTAPNGCMDTSNVYSIYVRHCSNLIAVRQLTLTARQVGSLGLLNWSTNSELDNDHFVLERSPDAVHFSFVCSVPSHGNSSSPQFYKWYDPLTIFNRAVYYRVKSVDKDGNAFYSAVAVLNPVKVNDESMIAVPSVTYGKTELIIQSNSFVQTNIAVYATDGKQVRSSAVTLVKGANATALDLGGLSAGVYLVTVRTNDGKLSTTLIKN